MEYANNFTSRPTQRRGRARGSPTIPPLSPIKGSNPQSARIVHQLELIPTAPLNKLRDWERARSPACRSRSLPSATSSASLIVYGTIVYTIQALGRKVRQVLES